MAGRGVTLRLELAAGGPKVDLLAAFRAEALKGAFIVPAALEMDGADQSLEIL